MTDGRRQRHSIFGGLLLLIVGAIFLLHNLRGDFPSIWQLFHRWWPLLLIFWGVARLVDYLLSQRAGQASPRTISSGDIFLIILIIAIAAGAGFIEWIPHTPFADVPEVFVGPRHSFSEEVTPKAVPANARISIRTDRGDISVHPEGAAEVRVIAKKTLTGWTESEARERARQVSVNITEAGGEFGIHPDARGNSGDRLQVDLEVHVPNTASITARSDRGNVQVLGAAGNVTAGTGNGSVEIRDAGGDVAVDAKHGDIRITGAGGNVKLTGRGGEVEIADVKGEATLDGEFFGPIRLEKVAKGAHFVSRRTDLTVSQLSGRLQIGSGSGKLEITDARGNVSLTTKGYNVSLDNITGRIQLEDREGNIELRLAQPPREPLELSTHSGHIDLVLPPQSTFEVHAEARSGDIESDFSDPALSKTVQQGNSRLDGKVGSRGPVIHLRTTYGTIRLRKGK